MIERAREVVGRLTGWRSDDWQDIAGLHGYEADDALRERLESIAARDEGERLHALGRLIDFEARLPDPQRGDFVRARLRAMLALDDEAAPRIADTYETLLASMPGEAAYMHSAYVQNFGRELPLHDAERLQDLMPGIFGEKPREEYADTPGPEQPNDAYPAERWSTYWERKKAGE